MLDKARNLVRNLSYNKVGGRKSRVVFDAASDQDERADQITGEVDRSERTRVGGKLVELGRVADCDVVSRICLAPLRNFQIALDVVAGSSSKNRASVVYGFDYAIGDRGRDNSLVVAHR